MGISQTGNHVVLLGDSIFDNATYVPGERPVIDQLRQHLPKGWQATLAAVDGDTTPGLFDQTQRLPPSATHLIISSGGNDALQELERLNLPVDSMRSALTRLADIHETFETKYRAMLEHVQSLGKHVAVCTIYESVPGLERYLRSTLSLFNDVILREAIRARIPVIDLRHICTLPSDYSALSPIEPSSAGGMKIAKAIAALLLNHELNVQGTLIITGGVNP
jgi:lysophospholipase L1-like esterase